MPGDPKESKDEGRLRQLPAYTGASAPTVVRPPEDTVVTARPAWRRLLPWGIAGLAAFGFGGVLSRLTGTDEPRAPVVPSVRPVLAASATPSAPVPAAPSASAPAQTLSITDLALAHPPSKKRPSSSKLPTKKPMQGKPGSTDKPKPTPPVDIPSGI